MVTLKDASLSLIMMSALLTAGGLSWSSAQAAGAGSGAGSRFADVWDTVASDPYSTWPEDRVTPMRLYRGFTSLIARASARTLQSEQDLLPYFDKLIHPNGICYRGTWAITHDNPYSGYFRNGSRGLMIARISSSFGTTNGFGRPIMGIAGKLYPTSDPEHEAPLKTANFFALDEFPFTSKTSFLDGEYTNDIIKVHPTLSSLWGLPLSVAKALLVSPSALILARDLPLAANEDLATVMIRELYPIAEMGLQPGEKSQAPVWMKLSATKTAGRNAAEGEALRGIGDYRHELSTEQLPDGIRLELAVASRGERLGKKQWQTIGHIHLTDSVVTSSCDHRLHFPHPPARRAYSPVASFR